MKTFLTLFLVLSSLSTFAKSEAPFYLGDWVQGCTIIGEDDVVKNLILIDSKLMDHVVIAYEEEGCKSPYLIFTRKYKLDAGELAAGEKKVEIETTVAEVSYQSLTDEVTEALNMIAFCGDTDWETYKEKIVTGKTCQDYKAPAVGTAVKHQFSTKTKSELLLNDDPTPYYKLMP